MNTEVDAADDGDPKFGRLNSAGLEEFREKVRLDPPLGTDA
jgi:hypothetical protein